MGELLSDCFMYEAYKAKIPLCNIMGVDVAAIDMEWLLLYLDENIHKLAGDYICVTNVHTAVLASENLTYRAVQNGGVLAIPDGGPLSSVGRRRGFTEMKRTTGPDLMENIFKVSVEKGYRHFFYGSTEKTLALICNKLEKEYPGIQISGVHSPPFGSDCDDKILLNMNKVKSDFIWVGLGAPRQENWMAANQGKVNGLMIGVGAAFDYYAGNIKRAPEWMQNHNLEWFCRLLQDPKRLFWRYLRTNVKFIWNAVIRGK